MKTKLYWTLQHVKQAVQDVRFTMACWWLSQRVDFLEWRWSLDWLTPQTRSVPAVIQTQQGGRYAVRPR
ncbi:hypothetical protein [Petrachloros mirabilis]